MVAICSEWCERFRATSGRTADKQRVSRPARHVLVRCQFPLCCCWAKHLATRGAEFLLIEISRLHPSEFDLLKTVDDGYAPSPVNSIALVARNSSRIVGRLFAMAPFHAEGIFIEPEYRGGPLFKDMMNRLEIECRAEGLTRLFAYAVKPEIGSYIERRCGYSQLPWHVYTKELAGGALSRMR